MKKVNPWVISFALAIILFAVAYLLFPYYSQLIKSQLGDIPLVEMEKGTNQSNRLLLSITFGIIPLMVGVVNFLFQAKGKYNFYVYISMIASLLIFNQYRIYSLKQNFIKEQAKYGEYIRIQFAIENLHIETFTFIGALIGCVVGALFLNRFKKRNML